MKANPRIHNRRAFVIEAPHEFHHGLGNILTGCDHSLLVSAHPTGDSDEEELKLSRHRVVNLSKVTVAQSAIWSRLNFLAVQPHGMRKR